MMSGSKELLKVFKNLCSRYLGEENAQFLRLIQKHFDNCNEKFRNSPDMEELLKNATAKILNDQKHLFIHLRDLVTELRAWSIRSHSLAKDAGNHKRKASDPCQAEAKVARYEASDLNSDSSPQNGSQHSDSDHFRVDQPQVDKENHGASTLNGNPNTEIDHKNSFLNCIRLCEKGSSYSDCKDKSSAMLTEPATNHSTSQGCNSCAAESSNMAASSAVRWQTDQETGPLVAASCEESMSSDKDIVCLTDDSHVEFTTSDTGDAAKNVDALPLKPECSSSSAPGDLEESRHERHVLRLENLLQQIRDKIEQIRESELSLEDLDNEDSAYIFEDRLQKKFVKVWKKLCELKGRAPTTGRPVERVFKYQGTRFPEINRKISKCVNRRKIFPDYHDIRGIVKKVNTRLKLNLSVNQMNNISREAFLDVGEALQDRRHKDFISTFRSKQTMDFRSDHDPALYDEALHRKLNENRRIGVSRLEQVISKYTNLEFEKGEEPKEVPDSSDADCSHKSDDEEEDEEDDVKRDDWKEDGDTEEKDDFLIEMDLDQSCSEVEGGMLDGGEDDVTRATVSGSAVVDNAVLRNGSFNANAALDWSSRTENGVHQQEPGAEDGVENLTSSKEIHRQQTSLWSGSVAATAVTRDGSVFLDKTVTSDSTVTYDRTWHSDRTVRNETITAPAHFMTDDKKCDFKRTALANNHLASCVKPSCKNTLMDGSQKKFHLPVKVSTHIKIPSYLTRPAGSRNGKAALFYPSKINTAVNIHMVDDVMIINSSDEEDAQKTARTDQDVGSPSPPPSGLSSPPWLVPSLPNLSSVECTKPKSLLTGDDDLIVLSD